VEFSYHGKRRRAEPYNLHRAGNGNLLLYAWELEAGQIKAFSVSDIRDLRVTDESFIPRFQTPLRPVGRKSTVAGKRSASRLPKPARARRVKKPGST
ncbi:MAG TPA: WYL domain-containing protein, partial [Myxococcota bacterium]|nr:WYL domain-containing protein [Myxococcota bacterium]HRY94743.1 WYL domain-containing protein [Myxococcota bacterium]